MSQQLHLAVEAARRGEPCPIARGWTKEGDLAVFHAWHVASVERERGEKILPGLPDEGSGLLMFDPSRNL